MLALCSASLLLFVATPQSAELIERTYDMRALDIFAELDATVPDPRLPLTAAFLDALEPNPDWLPWPTLGSVPGGDWERIVSPLLIDAVFTGLSVWIKVTPAEDGVVDLQHIVQRSELIDMGEQSASIPEATEFPSLSFPKVRSTDSWSDQPMPLGEWVHLRTTSRGLEQSEVLFVRIRELAR